MLFRSRLGVRVAWISRGSSALLPEAATVVQDLDRLHVAVVSERVGAVQRALSRSPASEV